MFVQKLLKKQNYPEPKVYVNVKGMDADVEQNGNSVIIIDDQVDITNGKTEQVSVHIYTYSLYFFFFSL